MTAPQSHPHRNSAAYKASEYLFREGPKTERELLAAVDFGMAYEAPNRLQASITSGWLTTTSTGTIACGARAVEHFAERPKKYVGQKAEPRQVDVMHRKPYRTPARFVRGDAEWSIRPGMVFYKG
jgi:hypothetical protein